MNEKSLWFMFSALCQYLEQKGHLDSAEYRSLCHEMLSHMPDSVRSEIEPTIAKMSALGWKPKVAD